MRYLVALDGWEPSEHALEYAVEQATHTGAGIDVVHVVDEGGGNSESNEQIRETVREIVGDSGVEYEVHFVETDKRTKPADKVGKRILAFAEDGGHDAVYLGNESTGTAERVIIGSVARRVIEERSVPVMLVP
jgi:nucleotide-binding universal stress UspA family protein